MKKIVIYALMLLACTTASAVGRKSKLTNQNNAATQELSAAGDNTATDTPSSFDMGTEIDEAEDDSTTWTMYFRDDTLFFSGKLEELPSRFVIAASDASAMFKQLPNDTTSGDYGDHPASDQYGDIWTSSRVNPYQVKVDSMPDSVLINIEGLRMPLGRDHVVTSPFGPRRYRYHYGVDLRVAVGDSIHALWDGQVRIVGWDPRGYGHYVVIRHDNGLETVYGHLSQPLFDENERIFAGEVLGLGGNTGRSTGPHLHLEIRYLGNAFNPEKILSFAAGGAKDNATSYLITRKETYSHLARNASNGTVSYSGQQYHKVKSGDTLSGIAKRYHTSVKAILNLNPKLKKNPDKLSLGQQIRVR